MLLCSCDAVKRVKDNEHLLTKNTIIVDGKVNKQERVNNLLLQKENTKIPLLGIPLRLHIYNLARPNIDSILQTNVLDNEKKVAWKTKLLSKKQLDRDIRARKGFNAWIKRTGEAPTIFDEEKTKKSKNNLRKYYFSKGWFDTEVDYEVSKDSNKQAKVTYKVTKNTPYVLDSIKTNIKTPAIDTIYAKHSAASLLKKGEQYDEENYADERARINTLMRNSGIYHFGQDYVSFEIDTIDTNKKINTELFIQNRLIRNEDSTRTEPFKVYKVKEVNIFTDYKPENYNFRQITDTTAYEGYNLYSFDKLKFKPKAITDAVFINKDSIYRDVDRTRTSRYINQLQMFRYPNISYVENPDTTLTANIYLFPRKKYSLGFDFDVSQSNIQTVGFSFSTGLKIRNIFRGAETLEISGLGSIGASKDGANSDDTFFDINEFGANLSLTIPRLFFPFNTDKIIPKYMSPSTKINISTTSQTNIGLDKQTLSSIFQYNWAPSKTVTNNLELFNIQFVKNLNTANYFDVYTNSYDRLNIIARDVNYIDDDDELGIPSEADQFISDVLSGNTSLSPVDNDYVAVNNIEQRKERLTEDNLILSTSFDYKKDRRENIFDNNFSIFKFHVELAGNLLSGISNIIGTEKNDNDRYDVFGVTFSQYFKTELDYIKYWDLGGSSNVLAIRSYFGIAIPYGNSNSIPFAESYFAGGPNDNRAWTAYNLGPGSSQNTNEFNEANLKLHFSVEQRFKLFGSLNGALFADAGNIWNALDNVEDDAATFDTIESLKDIAVGTGFGLRYDFNFFILRGDVGFKTYDPSLEIGNRWFKEYNFRNAVYNIGINYPF